MRIALITESVDRETGIGRIVHALARQFTQRGHEIHILAQHIAVEDSASHVHRLPRPTCWHSINRLALRYSVPPVLRKLDCDVANSYIVGRGATVVTAQSCHAAGLALRAQYDRMRPPGNAGLFDRIAVRDEKVLFQSPTTRRIIAVSQLVKNQICEYYEVDEKKIAIVPNGVDLQRFDEQRKGERRVEIRRALKLNDEERVLLFAGNEFARKGLHVILRAMARLRTYPLRLLVLGGDDPRPFVKLAQALGVDERLLFIGRKPEPEQYFAAGDVFVFPTFYEPFGLVIIEAMAAGIPVVTSKHAGAVEGMKTGEHGIFIDDPDSEEEVAAGLKCILDDATLSNLLVRNAREKVQAYGWESVAERTLNVYREAL